MSLEDEPWLRKYFAKMRKSCKRARNDKTGLVIGVEIFNDLMVRSLGDVMHRQSKVTARSS